MENTQVENQEVETVETEVEATEVETTEETIEERLARIDADQEKLQQDQKEFFLKQKKHEFEKNGLSEFEEIINVDNYEDLNKAITKLKKVVNTIKVEQSYQPKDNAKQDSYTVAKQNGDSRSMIKALFGSR